ncbi:MAG: alpha/beta hydrolase [Bacteroidota bacterium]
MRALVLGSLWVCMMLLMVSCPERTDLSEQRNEGHAKPEGPLLKTWFLSTGDWETDPKLFVREFGTGRDTVIMVHGGWGGEHKGMFDAVQSLEDDFHFVFYDQRGSLRSPCPDSLISYRNHILDLERLRAELNIKEMILVGHSMGTVLISAYAQEHPDRIKKLVLVSPAYLKEPIPEADKPLKHQMYLKSKAFRERPELAQELEKYDLNRSFPPLSSREETMKFRIGLSALMLYDIEKWKKSYAGGPFFNPKVYELTERTYPEGGWDFYKEFSKQSYPISVIIGDHDWLDFEVMLTRHWMKEVPRMELKIIEKAGHDLSVDQEQVFAQTLKHNLEN